MKPTNDDPAPAPSAGNKRKRISKALRQKSVQPGHDLDWTTVPTPDAWDFTDGANEGGFFGLEEIDGVDVEYIKNETGGTTIHFKKVPQPVKPIAEDQDEPAHQNKKKKVKSKKKKAIPAKPPSDASDPVEYMDANSLPWSEVHTSADVFASADDSGFYCLEELDGVNVVYEEVEGGGKVVKFKATRPLSKGKPAAPEEPLPNPEDFMAVDDFEEPEAESAKSNLVAADDADEDGSENWTDVDDDEEHGETSDEEDAPGADNEQSDVVTKRVGALSDEGTDMSAWLPLQLSAPLLRGLQEQKFGTPTEIQSAVLPIALQSERDVIGAAETGSGKTLAFGLPILQSIITSTPSILTKRDKNATLQALILTPTRELALQVAEHLNNVAKVNTHIHIIALVGGMSTYKQERLLRSRPHIIVATPGRLWELSTKDEGILTRLRQIKFLVLDEADRMLEAGHFRDLEHILRALSFKRKITNDVDYTETMDVGSEDDEVRPAPRQTFVFSATLIQDARLKRKLKKSNKGSFEGPSMKELLGRLEFRDPNPEYVNCIKSAMAKKITETRIECLLTDKDAYLYYLLIRYPGRTLVFVNSIDAIRRLVPIFTLLNIPAMGFHAEMQQRQRLKNLDKFISNPKTVLFASDAAARGLDIPHVEHVVHYQLPRTAELYVHRSGRTARGDVKDGISVVLCSPDEVGVYKRICHLLGKDDMDLFPVDRTLMRGIEKRLLLVKQINDEEHKLDKSEHEKKWLKKTAEDAGIDLEGGSTSNHPPLLRSSESDTESKAVSKKGLARKRAGLRSLRQELNVLLAQPILPKGVSGRYLTSGVVEGLPEVLMQNEGTSTLLPTIVASRAVDDAKKKHANKQRKR
ncbi:hypothetical protein SmJEL517_g02745 [Synchytrium microbalum]|uniref:ATP-dependent RNA helicase n=1 Tax=Synchytrium microbalum TaxID=1806994 RepID=A0A507C6F2_9FUNG|nr:uncharacterized protein SmJEL517_g02745 [Synchytrium microbalum]TPX34689.1 hypothetical protein SmJEL517_g02745 [Synchytrium microbalum]